MVSDRSWWWVMGGGKRRRISMNMGWVKMSVRWNRIRMNEGDYAMEYNTRSCFVVVVGRAVTSSK